MLIVAKKKKKHNQETGKEEKNRFFDKLTYEGNGAKHAAAKWVNWPNCDFESR